MGKGEGDGQWKGVQRLELGAVRQEEERRENSGRQCCITKIYTNFLLVNADLAQPGLRALYELEGTLNV